MPGSKYSRAQQSDTKGVDRNGLLDSVAKSTITIMLMPSGLIWCCYMYI